MSIKAWHELVCAIMARIECRGVAQLVARSVRDAEVACSSQVTPTNLYLCR